MAVINRIAGFSEEMAGWRRHIHMNPEIGFECHATAAFVVEKLKEFGVDEIHEGIAKSGVVALINGTGEGPVTGLRADMDALPMQEETGAEWASQVDGKMHACGHDGHTTMLLGAAKYLSETRNFKGRVALIFQPAEEGGGGGCVMVEEGMIERFGIDEVYALHTDPFAVVGELRTTAGPIMAAVDEWEITVKGVGGHAAYPHTCKDPMVTAMSIGMALQTIAARNSNPIDPIVVSVTQFHGGTASNIIADEIKLSGTVRTFSEHNRDLAERRIKEIAQAQATSYEMEAVVGYERSYPATVNHAPQVEKSAVVAREVVGDDMVVTDLPPEMGAEDFSYMLNKRPGAFYFIGQGIGPSVHHQEFDFNDEISPIGASFFARLIETLHS